MTKLVFHLGDKKTGSTAIQTTMALRAWTCDSVKLGYPTSGKVSHIGLAKSLQTRGQAASDAGRLDAVAENLKVVTDEIRATKPDVALISAEHFEEVDPAVLRDAIREHLPEFAGDARFIAYVRPHADRLASSYSERIKQGIFWGTIEDLHEQFLANGKLLYTPRFTKWRSVFGSQFELRPFVRDLLFHNDVVADVLQFALQTDDFQLHPIEHANESVSLENLTLLRRLQTYLRDRNPTVQPHQAAFGWAMARRMNVSPLGTGTKVQLHRSLAESVLENYREDAIALDAAFFTGTPMTTAILAAPNKAVTEPQSINAEDHYSVRELQLVDIFLDQIAALTNADPRYWGHLLRDQHRAVMQAKSLKPEESGIVRSRKVGPKRADGGGGKLAGGKKGGRKAGAGNAGPAKAATGKLRLGAAAARKKAMRSKSTIGSEE